MFDAFGLDVVFFETAGSLHRSRHAAIECVPMVPHIVVRVFCLVSDSDLPTTIERRDETWLPRPRIFDSRSTTPNAKTSGRRSVARLAFAVRCSCRSGDIRRRVVVSTKKSSKWPQRRACGARFRRNSPISMCRSVLGYDRFVRVLRVTTHRFR